MHDIEQRRSCESPRSGQWHWVLGKEPGPQFAARGHLAAVCNTDPNILRKLTDQYPHCRGVWAFEDILDDVYIHAVSIATPAETHGALVRNAHVAGKDVLVEKPLCLSEDQGRTLTVLAQERQHVVGTLSPDGDRSAKQSPRCVGISDSIP